MQMTDVSKLNSIILKLLKKVFKVLKGNVDDVKVDDLGESGRSNWVTKPQKYIKWTVQNTKVDGPQKMKLDGPQK